MGSYCAGRASRSVGRTKMVSRPGAGSGQDLPCVSVAGGFTSGSMSALTHSRGIAAAAPSTGIAVSSRPNALAAPAGQLAVHYPIGPARRSSAPTTRRTAGQAPTRTAASASRRPPATPLATAERPWDMAAGLFSQTGLSKPSCGFVRQCNSAGLPFEYRGSTAAEKFVHLGFGETEFLASTP